MQDVLVFEDSDTLKPEIANPTLNTGAYKNSLVELMMRRMEQLKSPEQFVFFTFRVDENNDVFVSWPASAYHFVPSRIIHRDQRTFDAVNRISRRNHIQAITVKGPIRTYDQYFPWIKEQYEV